MEYSNDYNNELEGGGFGIEQQQQQLEQEGNKSIGRGRGRGRGSGVPILPTGMWNDITNNKDEQDLNETSLGISSSNSITSNSNSKSMKKEFFEDDQKTLEEMQQMMFGGFGRGRGRGNGGGGGGGGGSGSFVRDAKGTDWECSSCGNVNWSWRTACNRCANPKPYVPVRIDT